MPDPKHNNPRLIPHLIDCVRDELLALVNFLYHQWFIVVAVVALVAWGLVTFNPMPPSRITLASGQENSTLEVVATRLAGQMTGHGVTTTLVGSRGALGNLQLLEEGAVEVALSQGGAPVDRSSGLLSLGSIGYQPLWLFLREPLGDGDLFAGLDGKRISVGLPGSGTRTIMDVMIALLDAGTRARYQWVELNAGESIQALREGRIDAMFLLAGIESGNAQALLQDPSIVIHDFTLAAGLTHHLDFTEQVILPKGAIAVHPPRPDRDIRMIATSTTLLIRPGVHPAIQHLLLTASTRLHQEEPSFFTRAGGFPAYTDPSLPLSEVAERYYAGSELPFARFLPFWLASLIDAVWFYVLAGIAIGYPLLRLMPAYRGVMFRLVAAQYYNRIRRLEQQWLMSGLTEDARLAALNTLRAMEHDVARIWVPTGFKAQYGSLRSALILAIERLRSAGEGNAAQAASHQPPSEQP
jgi:TRAP-type uncharacterized transport system substrate-binding protein